MCGVLPCVWIHAERLDKHLSEVTAETGILGSAGTISRRASVSGGLLSGEAMLHYAALFFAIALLAAFMGVCSDVPYSYAAGIPAATFSVLAVISLGIGLFAKS
jgi:hypothetical protein